METSKETGTISSRLRTFDAAGPAQYYRNQVGVITKENKKLRKRLQNLERENHDLKKSVYDISTKYDHVVKKYGEKASVFDVDAALQVSSGSGNDIDSQHLNIGDGLPPFSCIATFQGHNGAVHCAKFAPDGNLFASGSGDGNVRIWTTEKTQSSSCVQKLKGHQSLVIDLAWGPTSTNLLASGSFDRTLKLWDVNAGTMIYGYELDSFLQCVSMNESDGHLVCGSTAHGSVTLWDRRSPSAQKSAESKDGSAQPAALTTASLSTAISSLRKSSMETTKSNAINISNGQGVSSFVLVRDGLFILTADKGGKLRLWDTRNPSTHVDELNVSASPLTNIACTPHADPDQAGMMVAVNSYDSLIRVYHCNDLLSLNSMRLLHAMTGARNAHYPIRSSFCRMKSRVRNDLEPVPVLLLASGTVDANALVYYASPQSDSDQDDEALAVEARSRHPLPPGSLCQTLKGHRGRVYAAYFHPKKPALLTASSDATVKLWSPSSAYTELEEDRKD